MAGVTYMENEQDRWLQFLRGEGGFDDASPDWKHITVLNTANFTEPFVVPNSPFEGCGTPPEPPMVDNQDRVISYFKTKYVTFMKERL